MWKSAARTVLSRPPTIVGCLAATLLPYVGGGWVSDDFAHIIRLNDVRSAAELLVRPDAFSFYRPLPQLSLWLEGSVLGYVPSMFRISNAVLHIGVALLAFAVARKLLTPRAAAFAALAFVLTPKAPTVAVLWVSARPELLMSVFVLASTWAWLKWQEARGWWIVLSAVGYLLALLSKETAALLPLVLAFLVARKPVVTQRERLLAACAIAMIAALPVFLRVNAGALMPTSTHEQYTLDLSVYRLWRSLQVYTARAMISPVALVAVSVIAAAISIGYSGFLERLRRLDRNVTLPFVVWFVALMAPVFPIVARQELYLYLPGLGLCFLAGSIADAAIDNSPRAAIAAALCLYVVGFLTYQQLRHAEARVVQQFTAALVESIRNDPHLRITAGPVQFVAADPHSAELMRKGVGGYINGVTVLAVPGRTFPSSVAHDASTSSRNDIRYRFTRSGVILEY